ncbi:MAG TPA: alkaline phosphatase, partial [Chthoniobacteraceae bacterium]|nr:alkaline phosphatase [Chthoniobacteraceae bacterium]
LILELKGKNRPLVRTKAELENLSSFLGVGPSSNMVGVFSNDALAYRDKIDTASQQPSLSDMVGRAIEFLQYNTSGYVLVVDCELADRASGRNDGEHAIRQLIDMDNAMETAREYAGKKALIIAVGKHSTGGMSLNGYPLRQDKGVGLLGTDSHGTPSITWATGPNGPVIVTGSTVTPPGGTASPVVSTNVNLNKDEPAAFHSEQAINNADDVIAVGIGQGTQVLKGFQDNTIVFKIVNDNL